MKYYQVIAANGIGNFQSERFLAAEFMALPTSYKARQHMSTVFDSLTTTVLAGQISNLRQTRDLLLPRLISGELDVSGLEIALKESIA